MRDNKFMEFYNTITADKELEEEFKNIYLRHNKKGTPMNKVSRETFEDLVPLCSRCGFDITAEEAAEFFSVDEMELSENELDSVAGGKGDVYVYY
ncbi:MAG: hypothetical protein Q4D16_08335 [Eubacteriales bacterium]|nr:hypothetical protein [Eubacteriales bacterium]